MYNDAFFLIKIYDTSCIKLLNENSEIFDKIKNKKLLYKINMKNFRRLLLL